MNQLNIVGKPEQVVEALRNVAGTNRQRRAAVELLIKHGSWPVAWSMEGESSATSANNVQRFASQYSLPTVGWGVAVQWKAMAEHLDTAEHTYSGTEVKVFKVAASLYAGLPVDLREVTEGLERENARLLVDAVAGAAGPVTLTMALGEMTGDAQSAETRRAS
ncbi:hypothetical protein [Streptomyces griseosporeus]|uniref:hypothetical protein n=1 Tax=Streptomyces griseosporeus TaxID=1910 RepID=UPI0037B6E307